MPKRMYLSHRLFFGTMLYQRWLGVYHVIGRSVDGVFQHSSAVAPSVSTAPLLSMQGVGKKLRSAVRDAISRSNQDFILANKRWPSSGRFDIFVLSCGGQSILMSNAMAMHEALDAWIPPNGVEVVKFAGLEYTTLSSMTYTPSWCCALIGSIDHRPTMTRSGDGKVVTWSALAGTGTRIIWTWLPVQTSRINSATHSSSTTSICKERSKVSWHTDRRVPAITGQIHSSNSSGSRHAFAADIEPATALERCTGKDGPISTAVYRSLKSGIWRREVSLLGAGT